MTRVDPPRDLGAVPGERDAPGSDPDGPRLVSIGVHTEGGAMDDAAREVSGTLHGRRDAGFPTWVTGQAASLQDFTAAVARPGAVGRALDRGRDVPAALPAHRQRRDPGEGAGAQRRLPRAPASGVLVWVFQYGHLESVLRFSSDRRGIESVIPLLVLAFGFGLSMDYEVFLLARIIELHEQGYDDDTAVGSGCSAPAASSPRPR